MSQVIRISESTYTRLSSLAVGFDTPGNVIDRLLDLYDKHNNTGGNEVTLIPAEVPTPGSIINIDPENPDDLTHTKILSAQFGTERVKSWMELIYAAHKYAMGYFEDFEALKEATYSNIVKGSFTENGYHEYSDLGISIQGENANNSWRNALNLAKEINVSKIEVLFQWRSNKKSSRPGQKGKLVWTAKE